MATLICLNKPFNVLCQFSDRQGRRTLADYVDVPAVYPAGRLDYDSEGLVLLTDDGALQHRIAAPENKFRKVYRVQVEGIPDDDALAALANGVQLNDGRTAQALCRRLESFSEPWPRIPPVRHRASVPTQWIELVLTEGKNRQVRRMTAAVGHPTLRLIRTAIGPWQLSGLQPGEILTQQVDLPKAGARGSSRRSSKGRPRRSA